MRRTSITQGIARRVVLLLVAVCLLQVIATGWLLSRETTSLRQGPVVVFYDATGRIAHRSRTDRSLPRQLSEHHRRTARATPQRPVWLEPPSQRRDNVAVLYVPGKGGDRYLGIADRWSPPRIRSALLWSLGLGWLSALLIGFIGIQLITRRSQQMLARAESLVEKLAEGDHSVRLTERRTDEFGRLARSFNRLADTLASQTEQAEVQEARRRRALADWTHEMATPLSSVLGYLESLHHGDHDAETRARYVETAYNGALALRRLSDDLTTLSQVENEGHRLDLGPVDLKALAAQEQAAMAPKAAAKELDIRLEEVTPIGEITADGDRLAQVLRNLLTNAIRHTQSGRSIRIRLSEPDPDSVELAVIDEGEGIPAEHLDQIGQPFYRVDASRARATGGRGLGLAITKSLVEAHGGEVHIESTEGSGTVVRIVLPRMAEPRRTGP